MCVLRSCIHPMISVQIRTFPCVKLCNWSQDAVDKVSQDVTVLEVISVRQIDVNTSKPDYCAIPAAIPACHA